MSQFGINEVPILNEDGIVIDILLKDKINQENKIPNPVVIMARRIRGKRLLPHTSLTAQNQ